MGINRRKISETKSIEFGKAQGKANVSLKSEIS